MKREANMTRYRALLKLYLLSVLLIETLFKISELNAAPIRASSKLRFNCENLETVLYKPSGRQTLINWRDEAWRKAFKFEMNLSDRCRRVSNRFQEIANRGFLKEFSYTKIGKNYYVCAIRKKNDKEDCKKNTLFTVNLGQDPKTTVQILRAAFTQGRLPLDHSGSNGDIDSILLALPTVPLVPRSTCPIALPRTVQQGDLVVPIKFRREEVENKAKHFTVKIESYNRQGSGVIFSRIPDSNTKYFKYCVFTSKHNVELALGTGTQVKVTTPDNVREEGNIYDAQNLRPAAKIDLVVLEFVSSRYYDVVSLSNTSLRSNNLKGNSITGFDVYVLGYPRNKQYVLDNYPGSKKFSTLEVKTGRFRGLRQGVDGYDLTISDTTASEGMSGGPILNSEGLLLGIYGRTAGLEYNSTIIPVPESGVRAGIWINEERLREISRELNILVTSNSELPFNTIPSNSHIVPAKPK